MQAITENNLEVYDLNIGEYCIFKNDLKMLKKWNGELRDFVMDMACELGNIEMVKYLKQEGYKCSEDGMNFACLNGYLELVIYLNEELECKEGEYSLLYASMNGHLDIVEYLLYNTDTNIYDIDEAINASEENEYKDVNVYLKKFSLKTK